MLTSDIDSYYSPVEVTDVLRESLKGSTPRSVLDSNCGGGALLDVVERLHPKISCIGIDNDERAIRQLRTSRPHWTLVKGNSLKIGTWKRLPILLEKVDLAVLNPPFSMGSAKGLLVDHDREKLRCSLAMAHVLGTIHFSNPRHIFAILPSSSLASDLDSSARVLVEKKYDVDSMIAFKNSVFKGTRASSVLVRMVRKDTKITEMYTRSGGEEVESITRLVRGGLPVFEAKAEFEGVPFIHTTDLKYLEENDWSLIGKVFHIGRGVISGPAILIPRVGVPSKKLIAPHYFPTVQLSDCVIALQFENMTIARQAGKSIIENWASLMSIYIGTGARYVTMRRLSGWLASIGL